MIEKLMKILKIVNFSGNIVLKDGTPIVVEGGGLEKGATVKVQLPDATEPMLLPTGEYILEDDNIMVVKDGIIEDIKAPVAEPVEEEPVVEIEQEMSTEKPVEESTEEKPVETELALPDMKAKMTELESRIAALEASLVKASEDMSKQTNDFNDLKAKLEVTSGATKLTEKKVVVEKDALDLKVEQIKKLKK